MILHFNLRVAHMPGVVQMVLIRRSSFPNKAQIITSFPPPCKINPGFTVENGTLSRDTNVVVLHVGFQIRAARPILSQKLFSRRVSHLS